MSKLTLASSIVGIAVYIPLVMQILAGKVKQSFATWALWALLDGLAAASIMYQHGSYLLPLSYVVGASAVALSVLKTKDFSWTWVETMTALLVVVCIVIWAASGAYFATIASTSAVMIASIPLIVECYKKPEENPFWTYVGFFIANSLGTMGGKEWSVIERLYPAACAAMCLLIVYLISRKYFRKEDAPCISKA